MERWALDFRCQCTQQKLQSICAVSTLLNLEVDNEYLPQVDNVYLIQVDNDYLLHVNNEYLSQADNKIYHRSITSTYPRQ
jgi:hypothetical protein